MKIKEYNQMMKHLTRTKPEVEKSKKREFVRTPIEATQTQLKPLIDLKEIANMMMTLLRLEGSKLVRLLIQPTKLLMIRLKKEILKKKI